MPQQGLVQQSVSDRGTWRVASFGGLANDPSTRNYPFLNVFLAPLDDSARIAGHVVHRAMPIGELPLLEINAILRDGVVQRPDVRDSIRRVGDSFDLVVSTRRQALHVFDRLHRDAAGELIIPQASRWASDDPARRALFVGFQVDGDPFGLCVPCVEVLRFFYAASSVLARAVTSGWMLEPERLLWDPERCERPDDAGRAHLHLRAPMLDVDAVHLARFAFDAYALQCAQDVFLAAAGRTTPTSGEVDPTRLVRALPPFEQDDVMFTVQGVRLNGRSRGSRILALRIDACAFTARFAHLTFSRDNDGRADRAQTPERKPRPHRPVFIDPTTTKPEQLARLLKRTPARGQVPVQRLKLRAPKSRMPWIDAIRVEKVQRPPAKTRATGRMPIEMPPSSDGSVLPPDPQGNAAVDRVMIEGDRPIHRKEAADAGASADQIAASNRRVIEGLLELQRLNEAKVEFIALPSRRQELLHGQTANAFVQRAGTRSEWALIYASTGQARLAAVAEVRDKSGRVRYVIEIQHKKIDECSTLIVWRDNDPRLDAARVLAAALDCCEEERGANLDGTMRIGLKWRRRRHTESGVDLSVEAKRLHTFIFDASGHEPMHTRKPGKKSK